jgi:hypothetical protein
MERILSQSQMPIGQIALHRKLNLTHPLPFVQSFVLPGGRRTLEKAAGTEEYYPLVYRTADTLIGHLKFALKHEPLQLGIVFEALRQIGPRGLEAWVRREPTGKYSRRAWFLYETLLEETLSLPDAQGVGYVDALDERRHYGATGRNSARHRVRDNLFGPAGFCPTLRRTPRLEAMRAANWDAQALALTQQYDPETLARAVSYLYTKETRSSFALEGETPSKAREERFWQTLHQAAVFRPDKSQLVGLQNSIVDPRYAENDWRRIQNFVGETMHGYEERLHFICPRPQDVPALMQGWMLMTERILESDLDAVLAAAVSSFGFVFIHPFGDGNGRIHRFLLHSALARRRYSPPGIVLPVSAAILRQKHQYDQALEAFSKPTLAGIHWEPTSDGGIKVMNETAALYRYFDATPQAEFLYNQVAETIQEDFKKELDFLSIYDASLSAIRTVVDMPDRRASLLVRLCLQNGGRLSRAKRPQFAELSDEEIAEIESSIQGLRERIPNGSTAGAS